MASDIRIASTTSTSSSSKPAAAKSIPPSTATATAAMDDADAIVDSIFSSPSSSISSVLPSSSSTTAIAAATISVNGGEGEGEGEGEGTIAATTNGATTMMTTIADSSALTSSMAMMAMVDQEVLDRSVWLEATDEHVAMVARRLSTWMDLQGSGVETLVEAGMSEGKSLGFTEEEYAACMATISKAAGQINAVVTTLRERKVDDGKVGDLLVRRVTDVEHILEVRVAVAGNVDAGKSTMLGVLTHGVLDNGRGKARVNLFRHKHEIESGRTSSISHEILGFGAAGNICNYSSQHKISWEDVCSTSSKIITFIDLCGHEKYLKTTVFGMTGYAPDFVMLMIGANHGVIGMTKEHLGLALALNVPVFVIITKIDMCPENVLQETIKQLTKILKSAGCRKVPIFVDNPEDVLFSSRNFVNQRICPIFQVSNVTGQNLDLVRQFLNLLPVHKTFDVHSPFEFAIDETFTVPGVGTVVSGVLLNGVIHAGDTVLLGPDSVGAFYPVQLRSIHRKRVNVEAATAGQSVSFAVKRIKRAAVRKGMVMVSREMDPKACYEFEAEILILFHSTTISRKYQAMMHCGNVKQTAGIVHMDKEVLRTGDRATIRCRFLKQPEYLKVGERLLFREGRTKGIGKITKTFPFTATGEESSSKANLK